MADYQDMHNGHRIKIRRHPMRRKNMRYLIGSISLIIVLGFLIGCATAKRLNKIQVGMDKKEVIAIMGEPVSTSAINQQEYLNYRLSETGAEAYWSITKPYFIRLINNKVDSFGLLGDFDSIKNPTIKIEKDETIKQDTNIKTEEKTDLYNELVKLKGLREQGILSEEEYESKKNEILKKY